MDQIFFRLMEGIPCGVMVQVLSCVLQVSEFGLQSHDYVLLCSNTLWKKYKPLCDALNVSTDILPQGWLQHAITNVALYAIEESKPSLCNVDF